MKQILIILGLFASVSTFAQSPRIKLNQITKDTVKGSVLISSPSDSGMVYSRDFYIAYGADTVLILYGDTLAATSGIISSVLSDGVTITGDGTTGSELTVDTTSVIATKQDLDLYYLDSNPDGYTSNTGTVTSVGGTGTVNGISLSGTVTSSGDLTLGGTLSGVDLASQVTGTLPIANGGTGSATQNFVDLSSAQTVGGAKTFTSTVSATQSTAETASIVAQSNWGDTVTNPIITFGRIGLAVAGQIGYDETNTRLYIGTTTNHNLAIRTNNSDRLTIDNSGNVGIGTTSPSHPLEMGSGAHVTTGGVWTNASDIKLKENINYYYPYGLNQIMNLKPTVFDYINGEKNSLGFIAQDVFEVIPEAISSTLDKNGNETMGIKMVSINATLVKAIQEQQAIIETIQTELNAKSLIIETQQSEIDQLKTLITDLTNRLIILENK